MQKISTALSLSLLISLVTACVPTIAGKDGGFSVAYVAGELQAQEALTIDDTWNATISALESLELNVKEQDKDALSAKAIAYGADDKKITVRLRRESAESTSMKIRVGFWGDKEFSMTILEKIEEAAGRGSPIAGRSTSPLTERSRLPENGPAPAPRESLY